MKSNLSFVQDKKRKIQEKISVDDSIFGLSTVKDFE